MGSDETRAKITVNDTLTIKQVLQGVWRDFDVQGVSLEADGDRLLIASNLQEALDTYQRIEAPTTCTVTTTRVATRAPRMPTPR